MSGASRWENAGVVIYQGTFRRRAAHWALTGRGAAVPAQSGDTPIPRERPLDRFKQSFYTCV